MIWKRTPAVRSLVPVTFMAGPLSVGSRPGMRAPAGRHCSVRIRDSTPRDCGGDARAGRSSRQRPPSRRAATPPAHHLGLYVFSGRPEALRTGRRRFPLGIAGGVGGCPTRDPPACRPPGAGALRNSSGHFQGRNLRFPLDCRPADKAFSALRPPDRGADHPSAAPGVLPIRQSVIEREGGREHMGREVAPAAEVRMSQMRTAKCCS